MFPLVGASEIQSPGLESLPSPHLLAAEAATVPTHADPRLGALCGSFRLLRRVGKGGMGVVYEAVHQKIARRAAVKLLHARFAQDEQYAQRFLHEACAVNIIRHRGLVEIFEFGKLSDGTLFYVMEFLEGTSLQNRIVQRRVGSPPDEVIGLLLQLARALSAAHDTELDD